jgi:putative MATE family efflux protein
VSRLRRVGSLVAGVLASLGVIQRERLRATVDLAWPRVVTGFAIMSKRTVDLAFVGVAVGPTAVAGLTLANAYWMLGKFLAIGLAGGTIALVSQQFGGGESTRAARIVEQSCWLALALVVPTAIAFGLGARPLVGLVGDDPTTVGQGAAYLAVVAPGLVFEALNLVASRTYAGVGDTLTPMAVRAGGAGANIVLSAAFVFGLDMGVVGAALGTTIATAAVTVVFAWGMTGHSYLGRGASPVPISIRRPQWDPELVRQIVRVSTPLVGRRLAEGAVVFPLLAIAATFGPVAVAAVGVARQVRSLINSFSWGFSIAASTLVGQELGRGEESSAETLGREITQFSVLCYLLAAAVVVAFADPIARVFVEDAANVALSRRFVRVAAVSVVPLGVNATLTGILRGAGDTRVPFLASLLGFYVVALPVAWVGTVTPLGVAGLQVALLAETVVPMAVNWHRFTTNRWKAVSRAYRPGASD